MKTITLKLLFAVLISMLLFSCATDEDGIYSNNNATLQDISLNYTTLEYQILNLVNEHRSSLGLESLKTLNIISNEAIGHTDYMINLGEINHDNFDARYIKLVKSVSATRMAENVAYGYSSAEAVVKAWIKSDGHRKNIESNLFTDFGISTKQDENGRNYFTHIFIKR